jgi:hypothetical protein
MNNGIGGTKREVSNENNQVKRVGLLEATIIAVNPTIEDYKSKLGIELKEDSKAVEYLGESKDGNTTLRIDFWMQNAAKEEEKFKVTFYIEDRERQNKDKTKYQYINSVGMCSWGESENDLAPWFKGDAASPRDIRIAHSGEEELYDFLRTYLSKLDYRQADTTLTLDWKKLMKGNVSSIRNEINGEWCDNIIALATVTVKEREGEVKEYQTIYNKGFLPVYTLKQFRLVDYTDSNVVRKLSEKASKDLKPHERFVVKVTGEYGCKDYYILRDLQDYNPSENFVASDETMQEDDSDY